MKKQILSIVLTLCMVLVLCPVTAFADVPPDTIIGDINLDGTVTKKDALYLQNYLEGLESFTDKQLVVADFNGDGVVNYSDLAKLQSYLELLASAITVTKGKATACGTEISEAAEGTRVTLTADSPPDAMVFDKWIVGSGSNVTLADANSATTTFTMSKGPVNVAATYKPYPPAKRAVSPSRSTASRWAIRRTTSPSALPPRSRASNSAKTIFSFFTGKNAFSVKKRATCGISCIKPKRSRLVQAIGSR